jgi:glycosyltransferase involved in cell wall biosynthesis
VAAGIPLVSVIVPAFNAARFVESAVRSILEQSWPRIELIAIDDGSDDGTAERLEDLARSPGGRERAMQVLRQPRAGAAAARNRGMGLAKGEYIALFDADDCYHLQLVERQVCALGAEPDCDLAFAAYRYVDENGAGLGEERIASGRLGTLDLLADNRVHAPLFRASILPDTGLLDEELTAHIDLDFFVRVTRRRPESILAIGECLSDYRRHSGQITADWRRMRANHRTVLAKQEAAGLVLSPRERRRIEARVHLYWATLAYQAGDYRAARKLMARSLASTPAPVLADPHGRIRVAACLASLLPAPAHVWLRGVVNERSAT